MEAVQGTADPFTAPFMSTAPQNTLYPTNFFTREQKPGRFAFGFDGKIVLRPEDSGWIFAAAVRYGRSHASRHAHYQSSGRTFPVGRYQKTASGGRVFTPPLLAPATLVAKPFADTRSQSGESHTVVDFSVGRDVGIGALGRDGESDFSVGARIVEFTTRTTSTIYARPDVGAMNSQKYPVYIPVGVFTQYSQTGYAARSFHGIGPSLSWNASAALLGNVDDGELMLDWGVNAAILFGRQKAQADHGTAATHYSGKGQHYDGTVYPARSNPNTRTRSVTVPNIGGFAGLSVKYPNVKVSLGYRADFFFGAMDAGIDTRQTKNVGFHGPFATVSIGLGG
jgi:hypothetical protein